MALVIGCVPSYIIVRGDKSVPNGPNFYPHWSIVRTQPCDIGGDIASPWRRDLEFALFGKEVSNCVCDSGIWKDGKDVPGRTGKAEEERWRRAQEVSRDGSATEKNARSSIWWWQWWNSSHSERSKSCVHCVTLHCAVSYCDWMSFC